MWEALKALGIGTGAVVGAGANLYTALQGNKFMNKQMNLLEQQGSNQQTLFDKQMGLQAQNEQADWSGTAPQDTVAV